MSLWHTQTQVMTFTSQEILHMFLNVQTPWSGHDEPRLYVLRFSNKLIYPTVAELLRLYKTPPPQRGHTRTSLNTFHTLEATEIFTWSLAVSFNTSHIHFHSARHASATSFETFDIHTRPRANNSGMRVCCQQRLHEAVKTWEKPRSWKHLKCVFTFTVL